jgi:hypothetical protein
MDRHDEADRHIFVTLSCELACLSVCIHDFGTMYCNVTREFYESCLFHSEDTLCLGATLIQAGLTFVCQFYNNHVLPYITLIKILVCSICILWLESMLTKAN